MKIVLERKEVKEIKKIYEGIKETLIATGVASGEEFKGFEKDLKGNLIVKYSFFSGEIKIDINENFIAEVTALYGEVISKIMPMVISMIPAMKIIMSTVKEADVKFDRIIRKEEYTGDRRIDSVDSVPKTA